MDRSGDTEIVCLTWKDQRNRLTHREIERLRNRSLYTHFIFFQNKTCCVNLKEMDREMLLVEILTILTSNHRVARKSDYLHFYEMNEIIDSLSLCSSVFFGACFVVLSLFYLLFCISFSFFFFFSCPHFCAYMLVCAQKRTNPCIKKEKKRRRCLCIVI